MRNKDYYYNGSDTIHNEAEIQIFTIDKRAVKSDILSIATRAKNFAAQRSLTAAIIVEF